jgi:hypothetical protein
VFAPAAFAQEHGQIGVGVGTAVAYFTGKRDIRLPAETPLTFRLSQPLTILLKS